MLATGSGDPLALVEREERATREQITHELRRLPPDVANDRRHNFTSRVVGIDIPLADCKPEMLLLALEDLLHRRAGRLARVCESMKRERRYSKTEEARYRPWPRRLRNLPTNCPSSYSCSLSLATSTCSIRIEQAMRETHEADVHLDV
jgi:hypothetical protein